MYVYNYLQHNVEHYVHDDYFFQILYIDIMNQEDVNIMIAYPGEKKKCKQIRPNLEAAERVSVNSLTFINAITFRTIDDHDYSFTIEG